MDDKPSIKPFPESVPDGMVWTYQAVYRGGRITHLWSLADKTGGIHISANVMEWTSGGRDWIGGCETHYAAPPDYMKADKPSHEHCWVLGGPCWHDGSSLYFSENVAPMLPNAWDSNPNDMKTRHHEYVLSEMRHLHRIRFQVEQDDA